MRKLICVCFVAALALQLTGCGDGTPKQATDPAALDQERAKGRETRDNLEGGPKKAPR